MSDDLKIIEKKLEIHERKLNIEQNGVYKHITALINDERQHLTFIDAPAGTGKTFLLNTLLYYYILLKFYIIACASIGIAAIKYDEGCTLHSFFKIPLNINEHNSTCNIFKNKDRKLINLIVTAKFIIWDECTLLSKNVLECLDKTLQDLCEKHEGLGGKTFILAGDWRQCLPILINSSKFKVLETT